EIAKIELVDIKENNGKAINQTK
ncbi:MAG: hypothetical protein JWQ96_199, partial [Segetibacter sp.]|nr:hypothetical protein [Segetibacter sp.]